MSEPPVPAESQPSDPGQGPRRSTMPPPELSDRPAPASVGQLVLRTKRANAGLPRHRGARAEQAFLEGRLSDAAALGDPDAERTTSVALARLLASRGTDLDAATQLARRALALGEDPVLRAELAGWLSGLGEPELAAATLRGLVDPKKPKDSAQTLIRIAVLLARADDAAGAADALEEAAELDPEEVIANELQGTLAAWAPSEVPPARAADAYLRAAERRDVLKDREAAFEDRLRALEAAPAYELSARAVARALSERGRIGAADEVMRAHAAALPADRARAVHVERLFKALSEGNHARAFGAVLDARLEGDDSPEYAAKVDELLTLAGLYELLAARMELRAEAAYGHARSDAFQALAQLYSGPLASPERALEAWIEAAAANPENASARAALVDHAELVSDPWPLCEAYIRAVAPGGAGRIDDSQRRAAARELSTVAEESLGDAALADWAADQLAHLDPESDAASATKHRVEAGRRRYDEEVESAEKTLATANDSGTRIGAMRTLALLRRSRPDERARAFEAVAAVVRADPTDRAMALLLDRLARRPTADGEVPRPELELYETVLRARLEGTLPRGDQVKTRLTLARLARRAGDPRAALEEAEALLAEAPGHRWAASVALLLALQADHPRARAEALEQLAGPVAVTLRAVLLSVAAELLHGVGQADEAARLAEQAAEADPSCARAVATLATIAGNRQDRVGAAALERAMGVVVPRGPLCELLASSLESLSEMPLALAWTQRWLALRPGDARAARALIRRAAAARDGARLSDALSWVLAQPEPLGQLVEPFTAALGTLDDLDRQRCAAIGRRALDVFGPRVPDLRARLLEIADRSANRSLAIGVLERWIAADPAVGWEVLLDLSNRRRAAGDFDGAARELCRALDQGAPPAQALLALNLLDDALQSASGQHSSDGRLANAEVRARCLTLLAPAPANVARSSQEERAVALDAAHAWRLLGSLRWDLADDWRGAEQAFFAASELDAEDGVRVYVADLCEFAGTEEALEAVAERASMMADETPRTRANLLLALSELAHRSGDHERCVAAAAEAIEIDATRADAVALVEKSAHIEGGIEALDRIYDRLAEVAMGSYGRRAAHYRGARQLERRGRDDLALKHAIAAFEAVPGEGTTFVLLARLAERVGRATDAISAIERVAEAGEPHARAAWLRRAAELADGSPESLQRRIDVLLRALVLMPDANIVEDLGRSFALHAPEDDEAKELVSMRLERAFRNVLQKLGGADGARTAIAIALVCLQRIARPELALEALSRAVVSDGDIDDYQALSTRVKELATHGERASRVVRQVEALAADPHRTASRALLELGAALADEVHEPRSAAGLLVHAAKREPDDDMLVHAAGQAVKSLGDTKLEQEFATVAPPVQRVEAGLALAKEHAEAGNLVEAAAELTSTLDACASEEEREDVALQLGELYQAQGRIDDAVELFRAEIARHFGPSERRLRWGRRLSALLAGRERHQEALAAMVLVTPRSTKDPDQLRELLALARAAGDAPTQLELLSRLSDRADDAHDRIEMLKELSALSREVGDHGAAERHLQAVARLDPGDARTLEELERDAQSRGDHDAVAGLLGRRAEKATGDQRRLLRLRRAAVLEQRLGRLEDASRELERLVEESPDDRSALPFLADLLERQGAALRAAPLWGRMSEIAADDEERADYAMRASRAYLDGGDVESARAAMSTTTSGDERRLALLVEIARRSPNSAALSDAVAELADKSRQSDEERARLYLESARAASASGNLALALARARRAKELAPTWPEGVLEARRLQYITAGTGTPREAQEAVDELFEIEEELRLPHMELHAFLLAEELDVIQGGGAGMRELSRRHAELGPAPLIALGMAERLMRGKSFEAAVPLFERALGGDLRGMRPRGRVALAAAEAATNAGEYDTAARLLEEAAAEPDTKKAAARRQLELTALRGEPEARRSALELLVPQSSGVNKARVLGQLARMVSVDDRTEAEQLYEQAVQLAKGDRLLRDRLIDELADLRIDRAAQASLPPDDAPPPSSRSPSSGAPPPLRMRGGSLSRRDPPPQTSPLATSQPPDDDDEPTAEEEAKMATTQRAVTPPSVAASRPHPLSTTLPSEGADLVGFDIPSPSVAVESAPPVPTERLVSPLPPTLPDHAVRGDDRFERPSEPHAAPRSPMPPRISRPTAPNEHEARLFAELVAGSFQAGDELVEIYAKEPEEHAHDLVTVLRYQATIRPGDRRLYAALKTAAEADRHPVYARAVEHVIRAFDPAAGPLAPPPLEHQQVSPELVVSLLFRDLATDVNHALAIAWETGLFRRDPTHYALTGVERVHAGGATLLSEVYSSVIRVFGFTTPLFFRRDTSDPIASVALLAPPSVVLTGEVAAETPELRYRLGASLAAAMPDNALVMGADAVKVRVLIDAILAAFGPVERAPASFTPGTQGPFSVRTASEVARIGGDLWQLVPPPAQRRMQAICSEPSRVTYEIALQSSRQAMRRAGLFAAGDLETAVREVVRELSLKLSEPLESPEGLRRACEEHASIADLVRLATRSEYADARWESASNMAIRRPSGSQRGRARPSG